MQRRGTFGGGVSPRDALLRGQSIIEYVLIIAVIGLVIVFAGPGVAGAIRNQFNLVGNTVNSGTAGGTEGGTAGGGSAGADSATVQAAVAKDAKDWTLGEQKAVAEDIAAKGEASPAYAKAKVAMDAGTKFSMKLTDGKTLEYRIIGINHDDLADGSGKAGLTFLTTSAGIKSRMSSSCWFDDGGWEGSELRAKMNSGEIWNLMPSEFQSKVKSVSKQTVSQLRNDRSDIGTTDPANKNAAVTVTSDKLFLLSYSEIVETPYSSLSAWSWVGKEGTQYEAFKGKVTNNNNSNRAIVLGSLGSGSKWWERSGHPMYPSMCLRVDEWGDPLEESNPLESLCVCPAWCF